MTWNLNGKHLVDPKRTLRAIISSSVPLISQFAHITLALTQHLPQSLHWLQRMCQVGSEGRINVGNGGQTARIWAFKMKFAPNKSFTFDIQYEDEDDNEISTVSVKCRPASRTFIRRTCGHVVKRWLPYTLTLAVSGSNALPYHEEGGSRIQCHFGVFP